MLFFRFFVVQSAGKENSREEHLHDESTLHQDDGHDHSSFSDSEEEEETQGIVTGIHCQTVSELTHCQVLETIAAFALEFLFSW